MDWDCLIDWETDYFFFFCRKCSVKVDRNIKEIHSPAIQKDLLTLEEQEVSS